jgi:uncharacterized membrane protein (UPF0127 family)
MSPKTYVKVVNRKTGQIFIESARWCESRICRLVGLQFHKPIKSGDALILVMPREGISLTSIHMFFVFFPIAAVWVNDQGQVVSAQLAKPWHPYYASPMPARYVIETTPDFLNQISVGDEIDFG